jgi:ribosomal-protein-alanine N-acetyltransferase
VIVRDETNLTIRPAMAADLEQVTAIEQACFSDPWTPEAFASALTLSHIRFLVAEEIDDPASGNGVPAVDHGGGVSRVVGYVLAMVAADEGEIADLAVAPAVRRRGVAGELLDRVAADARQAGVRALYLEVRESNVAAIALYRSRGFGPVGRRRGYYRHPPEDALLLRRDLGPA